MARKIFSIALLLFLTGCVVKKRTTYADNRTVSVKRSDAPPAPSDHIPADTGYNTTPDKIDQIINTAMQYSGVRYKFGGTSRKGMDCSGLLYVAFSAHDVPLPRVTDDMAEEGRRIRVNEVTKGDLLFFKTQKRGGRINHVGLVIDVNGNDIKFIHSTSSRGVIVSSLHEGFWNYAFVKAARVL